MNLESILEDVSAGELSVTEARERIEGFTRVDDFARFDTRREDRNGVPEVILADGKRPADVASIAEQALEKKGRVIITRIDDETKIALKDVQSSAIELEWIEQAQIMVLRTSEYEPPATDGTVAVLAGGTSDIPVAEEAAITAREMGCKVETIYDIGVAGIHRMFAERHQFDNADCVIVAAGREGALPTVVAGMVDAPVIGLPVSIGYGAGADGKAALLGMLQSCTVLSVVNIDAGFVAGAQAAQAARG
ncbi:nickel pincer cofactor biosynthesis protein LarB [Halobacterium sp. KA-4]|uniref:nickel pincer cofactor biosynthesis protein LarB n=1 Tax=Halobacterium sp. KA-4 TaxID=2896367 RepID=UPI001E2F3395|nr:nickel pincer cofactor biosynthesis protein LarB [Halobacterium sp. KA-4]MCD2201710.1 nickel pincer cofactor biosynthesis protein LarB [Halobacterium sp. KA-4]